MRKTTTMMAAIVLMAWGSTGMAQEKSANLAVNGTFNDELKGWHGQKQENGKSVKVESMLRVKTGKKGGKFLVITIDFAEQGEFYSNNTGAVMLLSKKIPKGSVVKVTFKAKWISGAKYLHVARTWGGGASVTELSGKTKTYALSFKVGYESSDLIFTLSNSPKPGQRRVENGVIILDDVKVEIEKK